MHCTRLSPSISADEQAESRSVVVQSKEYQSFRSAVSQKKVRIHMLSAFDPRRFRVQTRRARARSPRSLTP
jgi:hypothetical protein